MTIRHLAIICRPTVAITLLSFLGCLSPDPVLNPKSQIKKKTHTSETKQHTTAPQKINPAILRNRTFKEASLLAQRVLQEKLSPVSERLPQNPLIVVPLKEIGLYGGTLRRALTGDVVQIWGTNKTLGESLMGHERPIANSIQLNVAEDYQFQDDGRIAIFKIRKGVKWSDGVPYTVDDILFWYHDVTMNDEARNSSLPPSVWIVDDKLIQMEKVDDYTLKGTSPRPLGRVLYAFAMDYSALPKHILSRYHPKYNLEATYEAFRDNTTNAKLILKPGIPESPPGYQYNGTVASGSSTKEILTTGRLTPKAINSLMLTESSSPSSGILRSSSSSSSMVNSTSSDDISRSICCPPSKLEREKGNTNSDSPQLTQVRPSMSTGMLPSTHSHRLSGTSGYASPYPSPSTVKRLARSSTTACWNLEDTLSARLTPFTL